MATVSLPKEISALFADAHDDFPAITGKTSDDDVQRIHQCNLQTLQDIDL